MSRTPEQAVEWAKARVGDFGWDNLCLSYVRQSFGIDYVGDWPTPSRNAGTAWDRARFKHPTTDPGEVPFGVPVFFELATEADHVVLADRDGRCYSNDFVVDGRIDVVNIDDISARWGRMLGWTEDLVGNRIWTPPAPEPVEKKHVDLQIAHFSMQFSDGPEAWVRDSRRVLRRGYDWVTGTEAGENDRWQILQETAQKYGYRIVRFKSNWIAVKKDIIRKGSWTRDEVTVVDNDLTWGRGHDTSVLMVTFEHRDPDVGEIAVLCSHYPVKGDPGAKDPDRRRNLEWTTKVGQEVSRRMVELGRGKALAFYGGDQNIVDRDSDTFFGGPVTSAWDELEVYPNTGHNNIDVIASLNSDHRVEARAARAYNDQQLFLHSDHFLIEARYRVHKLKRS